MNEDENTQGQKGELRRRAEDLLQARGVRRGNLPVPGSMTEAELLDLVHEIHVHQIELEMQNEELRTAQEELSAARDRYFDLFDLAPVGYFMLDEEAAIVEMNLAGAELLGAKRGELSGRNITHYVYEQDRDQFFLMRRQVYRMGERVDGELRFLRPGEGLWFAHLTCAQVKKPADEAGMLRVILTDVTALKVSESNLRRYADQLEGLNKDLESFTYIASHDLQEPLRKIIHFGEFVKQQADQYKNEKLADNVMRMQDAAMRMQRLIDDLLMYARVSNRLPDFETTDLHQVVVDMVDDLEAQIRRSEAQVEVGDLPVISAESMMMRQLFQNLIGNALKFHAPDKPPVIRIEAVMNAPDVAEIRVADAGIGFDEMELEKIFRPFERLHGRNQYEGTGIGLAICRKIVEQHSGSITARSKPGEGATFIVTLPVQQVRSGSGK